MSGTDVHTDSSISLLTTVNDSSQLTALVLSADRSWVFPVLQYTEVTCTENTTVKE